tara:strand:+ start:1458 stop:1886 length:429 start_codon:yes stop_codon:yes gene_type:complete
MVDKTSVDGSCHCEAIKFKARVDVSRAVLCHCRDCQIMSGGPYRVILQTSEQDFQLVQGKPKQYIKLADSGNRRELAFCEVCSTQLYATSVVEDVPEGERLLGLRVGVLSQAAELRPRAQVWCKSRVSWCSDLSALHELDRQ